ncbi:ATP-dependent DNA helicase PIF1-like protein, partial [Tanacetum coccineum]
LWEENWTALLEDMLHKKGYSKGMEDPCRAEHAQLHSLLNPEQHMVYDKVIESVYSESGIASLLMPGSRTAHNRFVILLELDEAPMTRQYAFEALDKTLRDILGYTTPEKRNCIFGGMTILLGGDFRQILPVIPKAKRLEVLAVGDGRLPAKKKEIEDEPTWIEISEDFLIRTHRRPKSSVPDRVFKHAEFPRNALTCPLLEEGTPRDAHTKSESSLGPMQ